MDSSSPDSKANQSDDHSVYTSHVASPSKRANTKVSIAASQREKLKNIEGSCLITNEVETAAAIQACHIVRRKILGNEVQVFSLNSGYHC
jgi:hypothetical protein